MSCRSLVKTALCCGAGTCLLAPVRHSRSPLLSILSPSAPAPICPGGSKCLALPSYQRRHQRLPPRSFLHEKALCSCRLLAQAAAGRELGGLNGRAAQLCPCHLLSWPLLPAGSILLAWDWAALKLRSDNQLRGLLTAKICSIAGFTLSIWESPFRCNSLWHQCVGQTSILPLNLPGSPDFTPVP